VKINCRIKLIKVATIVVWFATLVENEITKLDRPSAIPVNYFFAINPSTGNLNLNKPAIIFMF
jgi:hypothetical protein